MAYVLQPMLKIREMREDKAQTALTAAKRLRLESERQREERRADLGRYEETREERRDAVFATVIGKVVSRAGIEVVQESVARIDEEGVLLRDNLRQADAVVAEKTKMENAAHAAYNAAQKNRMKIEEHRAIWEAEDRREQEYRADAELEDFTGRKQVSEDDDTFD